MKKHIDKVEGAVHEALGEASAIFMSQECRGVEIVMPTEELVRIGQTLVHEIRKSLKEEGDRRVEVEQNRRHDTICSICQKDINTQKSVQSAKK